MFTEEEVRKVVAEAYSDSDLSEYDSAVKFSDMGLDSLDVFNIVLGIQELRGEEIPDEDIRKLDSIAAVIDYLN